MKPFLTKILILAIICFGLDRAIGTYLGNEATKTKRDNRAELIVNGKIEANTLLLGSSRTSFNLRANTIAELTGLTTYNLGFPGSNVEFHTDILKLVTNHSPSLPKNIVLNIDEPAMLMDVEGYVYRIDALQPYNTYAPINDIIKGKTEKVGWVTSYSLTYRQSLNFYDVIKYKLKGLDPVKSTTNVQNDGSIHFLEGHPVQLPDSVKHQDAYDTANESNAKVSFFKEFISLCESNGINLIMIIPPSYQQPCEGFSERIKSIIGEGVPLLDYRTTFRKRSLFQDAGHLSNEGAQVFSALLAKDLKPLLKK